MIYFIYVLLILLITFIPSFSDNNKTRLSILVDNHISKVLEII